MRVARAFANLLRAAWHDPVWALTAVLLSPIRAFEPVVGGAVQVLAVGLVGVGLVTLATPAHSFLRAAANAGVVLFMAALAWRIITRPLVAYFGDLDEDAHGSARFARRQELGDLLGQDGLLIGRDERGRLLRYAGPAHLLTMAPTRTGKGVGTIIPNLLTADRSVICIDPKGENARVTGRARAAFGPLYCLDPFGLSGHPPARCNPLAGLDPYGLDIAEDTATLAEALVFDAPGEGGEAHWNEEAKALIGGLLLQAVTDEPAGRRHLGTLREYLTRGPGEFQELLTAMSASRAAHGLVARAANRHLSKSDREASGVLSAAQRHTHFLDSPRLVQTLERSDFAWGDLKRGTATVFLVLPPDRLATYARWLRLMVAQSLQELARTPGKPPAPVLYLLDEFAALGALAPVERAMGLMAGYGVQMWPILQDVHQLRDTYGQRAGTFLSNAAVLQVFGTNDHESARMVSDLLGQATVSFQTMSRALDAQGSGVSLSEHLTGRPLLTPDEVRTLPESRALLFIQGKRPILAGKLRYFADPEFAKLFNI